MKTNFIYKFPKYPGWKQLRAGQIIKKNDLFTAKINKPTINEPPNDAKTVLGGWLKVHDGMIGTKVYNNLNENLFYVRKID